MLGESRVARASKRVQYKSNKPSRTKKSFQAETDINNIMKRYEKTGQLPDLIKKNPQYGDFSNPIDYQESLNTVIKAEQQFSMLNAALRNKFNNDPVQFLEYCANPENQKEMVKLGLAVRRPGKKSEDVLKRSEDASGAAEGGAAKQAQSGA